jgi:hypothetical protein
MICRERGLNSNVCYRRPVHQGGSNKDEPVHIVAILYNLEGNIIKTIQSDPQPDSDARHIFVSKETLDQCPVLIPAVRRNAKLGDEDPLIFRI